MIAHVFEIKTQIRLDDSGDLAGMVRYRWTCSCHRVGPWKSSRANGSQAGKAARSARLGGERHVAAMERGR